MTTMIEEKFKCCVCGEKSSHMGIASTNSFGSPDLDTRPPEMERSTLEYLIQRCPSCGYCSLNLSKCSEHTKELVESLEYQNIINCEDAPGLATSFLALSYEKQQLHQYADSAWSAIRAAWICDDANIYDASKACREKAISMIEMCNGSSQKIADQVGASEAITIDLMRRASMFQQAMELVEITQTYMMEDIISQIIKYQEELIVLKDIDSHAISEAIIEQ